MESVSFWDVHGIFCGLLFIFFICIFPRITMLIATSVASVFGGPLFWIGWLLAPHLTVAIIATYMYWDTNPVLCVLAWLWFLPGETAEKKIVHKKVIS